MKLSKIRTTSAALVAGMVMATTLVAAPPANAGTVPNFYYCSRWTSKCVQINGPHVSSVPNSCHWVWTWYGSGMSTRGCQYWW
jgi:hypothetical protein